MGFFDFLFRRKKSGTPDAKESYGNKTLRKDENSNPGNEFLRKAGQKYQQGDFPKALDFIRKAQRHGKEPNSAMYAVIKSKLGLESQNKQEKLGLINRAILNKESLSFYYPSSKSQYYDLVPEIIPEELIEDCYVVDSKSAYYKITEMKEVKSFAKSYYDDKPN